MVGDPDLLEPNYPSTDVRIDEPDISPRLRKVIHKAIGKNLDNFTDCAWKWRSTLRCARNG